VAAKVTRDAWVEGWQFEEEGTNASHEGDEEVVHPWAGEMGSGYPSGKQIVFERVYECH
jgi:hypothetical protein